MKSQVLHYKQQRDALAHYLLQTVGLSKTALAKILGVSSQAVSVQFPTKKEDK